jgi:three-Cys-motif partner protein
MNDSEYLFTMPPSKPKEIEKKFKERNPIWTECKAKLIERYLFYFVQITFHGTYLDIFAGAQETKKPEMWAAKLVIESSPRWLKNFHLFELNAQKVKALQKMVDSQPPPNKQKKEPKRTVKIYPGDCNANIIKMLADNPIRDKEATFCLLDQRTFECDWDTIKAVATHKKGGNKIELFYFFPEGWINRSIAALKKEKPEKMLKWWGRSDWNELIKLQGAARAEYVCKRFKTEFGYKHVYPFAIYERKDLGGRVMYYMIHASDHPEAPVLMSRAYGKALDKKERPEQLDFLKDQSRLPMP